MAASKIVLEGNFSLILMKITNHMNFRYVLFIEVLYNDCTLIPVLHQNYHILSVFFFCFFFFFLNLGEPAINQQSPFSIAMPGDKFFLSVPFVIVNVVGSRSYTVPHQTAHGRSYNLLYSILDWIQRGLKSVFWCWEGRNYRYFCYNVKKKNNNNNEGELK